jgi:hypothetical protein
MNVFVFGSNTEGRHGKGAALEARMKHGAIYGQAEGRQGDSYAIPTKELRSWMPPVTLQDIDRAVQKFLLYAKQHPSTEFILTPIGCGLAGFKPEQIAPMFHDAPPNVKLPNEFLKILSK